MASQQDTPLPLDSRGLESEPQPAQSTSDSISARAAGGPLTSCSHCSSDRIVHWGAAHGLPRYRCLTCKRTFNILTNTPLAHLRNRERWLTYLGTMMEGRSIRGSASACAVSPATASRWRRRFTNCTVEQRARLLGAIIATYANPPGLAGSSGELNSANLAWCKDLLPIVLSWLA
jgi:transposase-like protein